MVRGELLVIFNQTFAIRRHWQFYLARFRLEHTCWQFYQSVLKRDPLRSICTQLNSRLGRDPRSCAGFIVVLLVSWSRFWGCIDASYLPLFITLPLEKRSRDILIIPTRSRRVRFLYPWRWSWIHAAIIILIIFMVSLFIVVGYQTNRYRKQFI